MKSSVVLILDPQRNKFEDDQPQRMVQMMLQLTCGPRRPKWLSIESALTTRSANLKEMDGSWILIYLDAYFDCRHAAFGWWPLLWNLGFGIQDSLEWKEGTYDHIVFFPWRQTVRFGCLFFPRINKSSTHSPHDNAGMTYGPICLSLPLWRVKLIVEWKVVDVVFP